MNCSRTIEYFDDYLAGRLSDSDRAQLEEHLQSCADCRLELEKESALIDILRKETIPDPGDLYWERLEQIILNRTFDHAPAEVEEPIRPARKIANPVLLYLLPLAASIAIFVFSMSDSDLWPFKSRQVKPVADTESLEMIKKDESIYLRINQDSELLGSIMMAPPGSIGGHLIIGQVGSNL